jgi:hypothetical protein
MVHLANAPGPISTRQSCELLRLSSATLRFLISRILGHSYYGCSSSLRAGWLKDLVLGALTICRQLLERLTVSPSRSPWAAKALKSGMGPGSAIHGSCVLMMPRCCCCYVADFACAFLSSLKLRCCFFRLSRPLCSLFCQCHKLQDGILTSNYIVCSFRCRRSKGRARRHQQR